MAFDLRQKRSLTQYHGKLRHYPGSWHRDRIRLQEAMHNTTPQCSIIIPVYNKWELTRNCLASLKEHSAGHDLEVVVVDNGSSDATATELKSLGASLFGARFVPIVFAENRNFGPACNAGAQQATAPVLFFLNNDTLLTPNWFAPLVEALLGDATLGAVGPLLLYEDNTVQHLGVVHGPRGPVHLYRNFRRDHPVVTKRRRFQAITGAAMMLRATTFHDCGGFWPDYRNGFEDVDLCCQIYRRGLYMTCVPESVVYHLESQTPGRKDCDGHNSELVHQRCEGLFYIDQHHHVMKDGLAVKLDDTLCLSTVLQQKDELLLLQQARQLGREGFMRLVRDNPLWLLGREVLASTLEKEGGHEGAMLLYEDLANLDTVLPRMRELERCLRRFPSPEVAQFLQNSMRRVMFMRENTQYCNATVRRIQGRIHPAGDAFLLKLLDAKLAEMFPV